ncbi:MAG TPA: hypothetical protein VEB18_03025 [Candidatus Paceibacterota bacterium]|nr:hypothetical protein [Candidatus Paceibacterota bacterium]
MADDYLPPFICMQCNTGHHDPRKITVCSHCGGENTIKVRTAATALRAVASAVHDVHRTVDSDDFEGFKSARIRLDEASQRLKPPSRR